MKKILLSAFLLGFGLVFQAQAANTNSNQGNKTGQVGKAVVQDNQTGNAIQTQEKNKVKNQGENTQIQTQEQNAVQTEDKKENKGQDKAESHRSTVATFV